MKPRLDHSDRLAALAEGARPDRPPASLWRHFYKDEDDLQQYVEAMVGWQSRFDWDFMKINARASYHYEPWGVIMRPSPDRLTKPQRIGFPIQTRLDWLKVTPRPMTDPRFDFQLRAISRIRKQVRRPFKIVMTVFNPISILGDMVAEEALLLSTLRESPEVLHGALRAVKDTFVGLVAEFRNAGADGIFFATTQWASSDRLSSQDLHSFVLPYDKEVWDSAGEDAFNVLHICDRNIHLREYKEFRAQIVNWDVALEGNPSLREGHEYLGRPVMGGVRHETDLKCQRPEQIGQFVRRLVETYGDIPYCVGPGCAIPVDSPDENVMAVRRAIEREE